MDPIQRNHDPVVISKVAGYEVTALAYYHIAARVLHTKRYFSSHADLVPVDLALGWGPMSDTDVLSKLSISQTNRFYFYEWRNAPPIPKGEMASHSANTHVIAADWHVASFIRSLRPGQLVDLRGRLVAVSNDRFSWRSSLSRTDTGNGACELFYVTEAKPFASNRFREEEGMGTEPRPTQESVNPTSSPPIARSLREWFSSLDSKRRSLDLNDPEAVRSFNEEVRQYSVANHTAGSPRPAATPEPVGSPGFQ